MSQIPLMTTPSPGVWNSQGHHIFDSERNSICNVDEILMGEDSGDDIHGEKNIMIKRPGQKMHISYIQDVPVGTKLAENDFVSILAPSLMGTKLLRLEKQWNN